jgi:hypothetical protein
MEQSWALFAFRKATTKNSKVDGHNSYSRKQIERVLIMGDNNKTGFRKMELMESSVALEKGLCCRSYRVVVVMERIVRRVSYV